MERWKDNFAYHKLVKNLVVNPKVIAPENVDKKCAA